MPIIIRIKIILIITLIEMLIKIQGQTNVCLMPIHTQTEMAIASIQILEIEVNTKIIIPIEITSQIVDGNRINDKDERAVSPLVGNANHI